MNIHHSPRKQKSYRDKYVDSDQLKYQDLDYERYEDLNEELDKQDIIKFIVLKGKEHKEALLKGVSTNLISYRSSNSRMTKNQQERSYSNLDK
jgi:hypothetical protein